MSQSTRQEKKLIAVVGATGAQGSSVLQYLVKSGRYRVRALTRDTMSVKAMNLRTYGNDVELWKCDMFNSDEVIKAFDGCWGAYLLTDFWWDPKRMITEEVRVGRTLIDAAVEANLKFAIWSSLHNVQILSEGKLQVPHFTNKGIVEEYARIEFKDRNIQTKFAFIYPGLYMQNFLRNVLPGVGFRINNGILENLPLPLDAKTRVPLINIDELGKWVLPMFDRWQDFQGQKVFASNDYITIPDFMGLVAKRLNLKYNYKTCSYDEFYNTTSSVEIVHMFRFFNEYGYYGGAELGNFRSWAKDVMSIQDAVNNLDWNSISRPGFTQQATAKIGDAMGAVKETVKGVFGSGEQKSETQAAE